MINWRLQIDHLTGFGKSATKAKPNHATDHYYSAQTSPRLDYVLNWLFTEQLKTVYTLVHNEQEINSSSFTISYGKQIPGTLSIPDTGLLWEQGVKQQDIKCDAWAELPTLFSIAENNYTIPFDLFSAIFFLLSRYEEYYTYTPDKYGRYPATESILYKNGLLQSPIVDEWVHQFRKLLKAQFNIQLPQANFSFQPTYDVDIAYSYLYKGVMRNTGGLVKDLISGKLHLVNERLNILNGAKKDPFDSFSFLAQLHQLHDLQPIYFILAALKNTAYDKNILPSQPAMQALLKQLTAEGQIGMHPSFYTDTNTKAWQDEKNILEQITTQRISASRQHYIKMKLPDTYRFLQEQNIAADYSMGYGTHLGFRAGTGQSFHWYDIEQEKMSSLLIHPFCFMDSTAHYEEGLSVGDAFNALEGMVQKLKETNSRLITIFHNFSLGTDNEWKGWVESYEQFIKNIP